MKTLYDLRKNFAIIGVTGRTGSGCSQVSKNLAQKDYFSKIQKRFEAEEKPYLEEDLKFKISLKYLCYENNWMPFQVIKYANVLFYELLFEAFVQHRENEDSKEFLKSVIISNKGKGKGKTYERFSSDDENDKKIVEFINNKIMPYKDRFDCYKCSTLDICLDDPNIPTYDHFVYIINPLAEKFYTLIKSLDYTKTKLFLHDISFEVRSTGCMKTDVNNSKPSMDSIYIIADTINRLIKCFRHKHKGQGRIVIDSLKNSLELTYFKERYASFYCIALNKVQEERYDYKFNIISEITSKNPKEHCKCNQEIDNIEYGGKDVNKGDFASPDIENCIQKSEYHIFYSNDWSKYSALMRGETKYSTSLDVQLTKFISLLFCPGIITPSSIERSMQVAYNAKANSGCISRQVGAVVTDKNHSIKAIGWNDVAKNQVPCNLRSLDDLRSKKNSSHFSDFERGISGEYKDGKTFLEKIKEIHSTDLSQKLGGRNCSFCFKSCHNSFEGKSNQVHTRSLHAEENAMLQITKYGGQGIEDGNLYTTASPCELCSKKAFQLGIKEIYYIDPYPGIATQHILKGAKEEELNPTLKMFRGAVGRGFHKLYEPFMNFKDELNIRANLHPKESKTRLVERLTSNIEIQEKINKLLKEELRAATSDDT